jgi:hypothetical protein
MNHSMVSYRGTMIFFLADQPCGSENRAIKVIRVAATTSTLPETYLDLLMGSTALQACFPYASGPAMPCTAGGPPFGRPRRTRVVEGSFYSLLISCNKLGDPPARALSFYV